MNKQLANFGRRLTAANMKKLQGGFRSGVSNASAGRCARTGPCMTVYVPGWVGCCSDCCLSADTGCVQQQEADPACAHI